MVMLDIETIAAITAIIYQMLLVMKHGSQLKLPLQHRQSRYQKLYKLRLKLRTVRLLLVRWFRFRILWIKVLGSGLMRIKVSK